MVSVVFDTSVLVSAFLTRHQPRGVSNELLRFVAEGKIELYLSADIITGIDSCCGEMDPGPSFSGVTVEYGSAEAVSAIWSSRGVRPEWQGEQRDPHHATPCTNAAGVMIGIWRNGLSASRSPSPEPAELALVMET